MAPVIWGLDLADLQWGKFKSSYMFKNRDYHLRRTKFIVYQLALIFCVVSESLGTDVLSDYIQGERKIQTQTANRIKVHNNDYVGAGSYNIFAGVFVAFIFGAAFFFDLFWPLRKESRAVRIAWKVCGVLAVIFHLGSALTLTTITAMHRSYLTNHTTHTRLDHAETQRWWSHYTKHSEAPLIYRHNARAIAAVVFVWLGWCSVVASCIILFLGIDNAEKGPGPLTKHAREQGLEEGRGEGSDVDEKKSESINQPEPENVASDLHPGVAPDTAPAAEYPSTLQAER